MAASLPPIPPEPIGDTQLWREFFRAIYDLLRANQSGSGGLPFTFPSVSTGAVLAGPVNSPGVPSFRQLTLTDLFSALMQWEGSALLTTVGLVSSGTWQGDVITNNYLPPNITGSYAPGSFGIDNGQFGFHIKQLVLEGTDRVDLQGNARLSIRN